MPTAAPLWTPTVAAATATPAAVSQPKPTTATSTLPPLDPSAVASVNGTPIARAAYEAQVEQAQVYMLKQPNLDVQTEEGRQALEHLQTQVLNWMVDQLLIQQAAVTLSIQVSQQAIDQQIAGMRGNDGQRFESWLAANGMTQESLRDQVRMDLLTSAVRDRVTASVSRNVEHLHVRHILVSEESVANEVLRRLNAGENFIALAKQYSEDAGTRNSGGDLGFVPRGVMTPRFDEAAFALKPGEYSGIIASPAGFQIVQLVEIDPKRAVEATYWPLVQQRAFEDWMEQQRSAAQIVRATP